MNFTALLEASAATNTNTAGSSMVTIVMLVIMIVIIYFFMIRPQKKQEKEQNAMRNGLMVGDEITTIGGIIGRIVSIKEETCVIETSRDCTKIRILKTAIKCVDVPASAAKGYVAPAVPAESAQKTEENTETVINGESSEGKKKKKK